MLAHKGSKEGLVAAAVIAGQAEEYDAKCVPAVIFTADFTAPRSPLRANFRGLCRRLLRRILRVPLSRGVCRLLRSLRRERFVHTRRRRSLCVVCKTRVLPTTPSWLVGSRGWLHSWLR